MSGRARCTRRHCLCRGSLACSVVGGVFEPLLPTRRLTRSVRTLEAECVAPQSPRVACKDS
eukprot:4081164-Prymnesium_polylepis.1